MRFKTTEMRIYFLDLVLEQFLVMLTPKEAALLPNYPNPFNPETWIPYQLAKAAEARVFIPLRFFTHLAKKRILFSP